MVKVVFLFRDDMKAFCVIKRKDMGEFPKEINDLFKTEEFREALFSGGIRTEDERNSLTYHFEYFD
jgi:hypothetical protein